MRSGIGYTGKEEDDETGLYYYGARYYASWLGRWTGCDPSVEDGWNLYVYVRNNPVVHFDPTGMFTSVDKTKPLKQFIKTFKLWETEALKHRNKTKYRIKDTTFEIEEPENEAKFRVFDTDFRSEKQMVDVLGKEKKFSYNKSFGKYLDVGLSLDVSHFFKMSYLGSKWPAFLVRYAYIHEENVQTKDPREMGRTSAYAPEDLFSNELGLIFSKNLNPKDNMGEEIEKFLKDLKTLFTTNSVKYGKYLNEKNVDRLRNIATKYYGTDDLREFNKQSKIYELSNIKQINENAAKKDYPFFKGFVNSKKNREVNADE